jgi:hypothetical protein
MKDYVCPVCQTSLVISNGGRSRPDGYTIYCPALSICMSTEQPLAFGRTKEAAYQNLLDKFGKHLPKNSKLKESAPEPTQEIPEDSKIKDIISYE